MLMLSVELKVPSRFVHIFDFEDRMPMALDQPELWIGIRGDTLIQQRTMISVESMVYRIDKPSPGAWLQGWVRQFWMDALDRGVRWSK
jgi:hypothetical protein